MSLKRTCGALLAGLSLATFVAPDRAVLRAAHAETPTPSHEGSLPDLSNPKIRARILELMDDMKRPDRTGELVKAGEGAGSSLFIGSGAANPTRQNEAARKFLAVLREGVDLLVAGVSDRTARDREGPFLYKDTYLFLDLKRGRTTEEPPPVDTYTDHYRTNGLAFAEGSGQYCWFSNIRWPFENRSAPKTFFEIQCIIHSVAQWLVFADFPRGSTERFLLGGETELTTEFDRNEMENYWFVVGGFGRYSVGQYAKMEGMTIGVSSGTAPGSELVLDTLHISANFSENCRETGKPNKEKRKRYNWDTGSYEYPRLGECSEESVSYTPSPDFLETASLHAQLARLGERLPKRAKKERTAISGAAALGTVHTEE